MITYTSKFVNFYLITIDTSRSYWEVKYSNYGSFISFNHSHPKEFITLIFIDYECE